MVYLVLIGGRDENSGEVGCRNVKQCAIGEPGWAPGTEGERGGSEALGEEWEESTRKLQKVGAARAHLTRSWNDSRWREGGRTHQGEEEDASKTSWSCEKLSKPQ